MLDSGFPFYDCYRTADGKYMAVGALEPQFQKEFIQKMELDISMGQLLTDAEMVREKVKQKFLSKTRAEWEQLFERVDACVTPVMELDEAAGHAQNAARDAFRSTGSSLRSQPGADAEADRRFAWEPRPAP